MDEVDGPVDGVDDPGGTVGQLDALTCGHRLLPDEPESSETPADFLPAGQSQPLPVLLRKPEPVLREALPDG